MNNSFPRLIDGMCATLRTEVLTRLDDEFARGQVYGVINLLNTLKARGDWSVGFLARQVSAQCEALNQVRQLLQGVLNAPALPELQAPTPISAQDMGALRDEHNRRIGDMLQWLALHRAQLAPETAQAVEAHLRQSMRTEIEIELRNSPRPLFAEMSSGQES
jgi:hypothetical protein